MLIIWTQDTPVSISSESWPTHVICGVSRKSIEVDRQSVGAAFCRNVMRNIGLFHKFSQIGYMHPRYMIVE